MKIIALWLSDNAVVVGMMMERCLLLAVLLTLSYVVMAEDPEVYYDAVSHVCLTFSSDY